MTPHQAVLRALHRDTSPRVDTAIALDARMDLVLVRRVLVELHELGLVMCREGWPAAWSLVGRSGRVWDEQVRA